MVIEKIKTRTLCSLTFLKNRTIYETMWKNTAEPESPQMTIWRKRIACCITKATDTLRICNTSFATTSSAALPQTEPASAAKSHETCNFQNSHEGIEL
jgi:hypothetical protein